MEISKMLLTLAFDRCLITDPKTVLKLHWVMKLSEKKKKTCRARAISVISFTRPK